MIWFAKRPGRKNMADIIVCPACGIKNRIRADIRGVPLCGKCKKPLLVQKKPAAQVLTEDNFDSFIGASSRPVLVDFWAKWCMPCRMLAPVLEKFAAAHASIALAKVDTDAQPRLASQYQIFSIPTLILFVGGREVHRLSGAVSATELAAAFKLWLQEKKPGAE
jgi:thioredoxin 2